MRRDIRAAVRGLYDLQQLRIQVGNRLVNHFLVKMGIEPSQRKTQQVNELLKELEKEYKRITDGLIDNKKFLDLISDKGLISFETEYALCEQYFTLLQQEKEQQKLLKKRLEQIPIYTEFLKHIKGVGVLMAGVIISEIDISKATYVSSLWKYSGLDVVNGIGRSKRKECLEEVEYIDKNGQKKKKLSITYNPFLKTKLVGVLADVFIKSKSEYRKYYDDYKNRLENHPKHKDKTKLHKHNMAKRYMIKMFLRDLYNAWRPLEGLEVYPPYEVAKLGIIHKHQTPGDNQVERVNHQARDNHRFGVNYA